MLRSRIVVDLPSAETARGKNPVEWVRSLFGAKLDLRSGKEELSVSAFSLVEGLVEAFTRVGVTDLVSFIVDKKVVYIDSRDVPDDLALVRTAAETKGVFERKFTEMHLVLAHREHGLHTLVDVRITSSVMLGEAEMQADLASRVTDLQIRTGESAHDFSERIRAFMADEANIQRFRVQLDALSARVGDALRASLVGAKVSVEPATVQVIRPDARAMTRFGTLGFGDAVESPHYRPVPTHHREGAYADPFFYYYYDPYYSFMSWVMLDSMLHSHYWHTPYVNVVDGGGHTLATGSDVSAAGDGWAGREAVHFDDHGAVAVALDPASAGDIGGDGASWGSGDTADSGGGGWSDSGSGSSDSGGSSCGSSCGGSSCGSSCGGGSD